MKKCVFAGSFDPITNGHLEIIKKASEQFDQVIVGILRNRDKQYYFPLEVRKLATEKAVEDIPNAIVKCYDGMLTDFLKQENTKIYVRGIRDEKDLAYELKCKEFNKIAMPDIKYFFINCSKECQNISSTLVKEKIILDQDISALVPQNSLKYLKKQ